MKDVQSSRLLLERRISILYGIDSLAMKALDLVVDEMRADKGFHRYDGTDYYMHCVDVANFLLSYGVTDQETIAAALLHDMVEDLPDYTTELIAHLFSERTAHYVELVTKKEHLDYHDPDVLKDYLNQISLDPHTALIKTADRMHNMYSLEDASMEKRYRKALETEQFFIPFFKLCRKKYPRYESLFQAAKTQILPQIYEIKAHYEDACLLERYRIEMHNN